MYWQKVKTQRTSGTEVSPLVNSVHQVSKNYFPYFSTKTNGVGTQKNRLTETDHPNGLAGHPTGLADHSTGLASHPTG